MAYYKHNETNNNKDKKSGQGLALSEWNSLSNAVAGNSGLTLALNGADKVGIGTTAPNAKLEVVGSPGVRAGISQIEYTEIGHGGSHGYINTAGDGNLDFRHDGETKMCINSDGNIGIGTTAPKAKLEVDGVVKIKGTSVARLTIEALKSTESSPAQTACIDLKGYGGRAKGLYISDPDQDNNKWFIGEAYFSGRGFSIGCGTKEVEKKGQAKLFIQPGGNVGIGTTDPKEKLHVNGNVKATKFIGDGSELKNLKVEIKSSNSTIFSTKGSKHSIIQLAELDNNPFANQGILFNSYAGTEKIKFPLANTLIDVTSIKHNSPENYYAGAILFDSTQGSMKFMAPKASGGKGANVGWNQVGMLLDKEGNVGIGTTNPQEKLHINGGSLRLGVQSDANKYANIYYSSGQSALIFEMPKTASHHGINHENYCNRVSWDGDSNWDWYSDIRLKTNIEVENDILKRLLQLDVKKYHWKHDNPDTKRKMIGFIAQDVQPLFPSLVGQTIEEDGKESTLTLKYASFGVLAVGAIKELKQEKDQEIAVLEARLALLEANKAASSVRMH